MGAMRVVGAVLGVCTERGELPTALRNCLAACAASLDHQAQCSPGGCARADCRVLG